MHIILANHKYIHDWMKIRDFLYIINCICKKNRISNIGKMHMIYCCILRIPDANNIFFFSWLFFLQKDFGWKYPCLNIISVKYWNKYFRPKLVVTLDALSKRHRCTKYWKFNWWLKHFFHFWFLGYLILWKWN